MISTPPLGLLYGATLSCIQSRIAAGLTVCPGRGTIKALGSSPVLASGIPITAQSRIAGWLRRTPSSLLLRER
jgi:hypothetical protein